MHAQDTPHPLKTEYRGRDWTRIQERWRGKPNAAVGGTAAVATAPRLGSSTHFDTYREATRAFPAPCYLATLKGFGQNGAELILRTTHEQPRDPTGPKKTKPPRHPKGTPRTEADQFHVEKSAWRARAQIRTWLRMMATPDRDYRMLTGTKRGGIETLDDCWQAVAAFRRQVERHYPGTVMIAVPELHLGGQANHGKFHVHMIAVFPPMAPGKVPAYSVFHRMWYKALGGTGAEKGTATPGNLDFAPTHAKDGTRYTPCQAARYLSKYVTKCTMVGNVGQKRFTTTHGAPDPVKRYWWEPIDTNHAATRSRAVQLLRYWFPGDTHMILSKTFHSGGDTYHVFSAEPVPKLTG